MSRWPSAWTIVATAKVVFSVPLQALLLGMTVAGFTGCFHRVDTVRPPSFDASAMAAQTLAEKDSNHDGAIVADELKDWPGMRSVFKAVDKNSDGKLDAVELEQHFSGYGKGSIGLQSLTVFVTSGGKPVSGTEVEFTPEPLFADYIKAGKAKTGSDGSGVVVPMEGKIPMMAPGMYRVTISKRNGDKETLPAKFNTESQLGFEISNALGGAPARFDIGR